MPGDFSSFALALGQTSEGSICAGNGNGDDSGSGFGCDADSEFSYSYDNPSPTDSASSPEHVLEDTDSVGGSLFGFDEGLVFSG